jgi:hypothetical protein
MYSDGEVRQEVTFVYAVEIESGEPKIDDESKEAALRFPVFDSGSDHPEAGPRINDTFPYSTLPFGAAPEHSVTRSAPTSE